MIKKEKQSAVKDLPELALNFFFAHERMQNFSVLEGTKIQRDKTIKFEVDI